MRARTNGKLSRRAELEGRELRKLGNRAYNLIIDAEAIHRRRIQVLRNRDEILRQRQEVLAEIERSTSDGGWPVRAPHRFVRSESRELQRKANGAKRRYRSLSYR